jgi:amidohydrolase
MSTIAKARAIADQLVAMRRHLHANPELNFAEFETAAYARQKLEELGFVVRQAGTSTGLIADFGSGENLVAIRCDMDALPVNELNRTEYTSRKPGVMHACGHDAHLAIAIGVARLLTEMPLAGRVRIIVQPGDDQDGRPGALTMIEAGALDGVSALLGLHVDATVPAGKLGIVTGAILPSIQQFEVEISDSDSEEGPELALAVATMISGLYGLTESLGVAGDQISLSVETVELSASKRHAHIAGVIKSFNAELGARAQAEVEKIVRANRVSATVQFVSAAAPKVDSANIAAVMHAAAVELLGPQNVLSIKRKSWNFQFLLYTEHVPGSMIYLGAELSSSRRTHQSATFDIDENCLPAGAAVLAETAARLTGGF